MQLCTDVKRLCTSLKSLRMFKRGKETKRSKLEISQPFNFKREITTLPGLSEDEISVLREQAAASCVGIAEAKAEHNNRQMQHQVRQHSPHHTRSRSTNGTRSRSTSASPQRVHGQGHPYARPPTSHSTNSLIDYRSATPTQRSPLIGTATSNTGTHHPPRSYTPGAGSIRSNRSGNGRGNSSRCASPMSMSNRSLNRLVLPSLTNSSPNGSGTNSDCDSPGVGTPGGVTGTAPSTGIGKLRGLQILDKLELNMPVSPVSNLGSSDLDGEDRFFIGSPISPLSPRGSPKSAKVRL